jgi:hypothetical protein
MSQSLGKIKLEQSFCRSGENVQFTRINRYPSSSHLLGGNSSQLHVADFDNKEILKIFPTLLLELFAREAVHANYTFSGKLT